MPRASSQTHAHTNVKVQANTTDVYTESGMYTVADYTHANTNTLESSDIYAAYNNIVKLCSCHIFVLDVCVYSPVCVPECDICIYVPRPQTALQMAQKCHQFMCR